MPYIQLNDIRHPLRVGAMRVGAAADAELRLPGASDPAAAAVVEVRADQSASIRRAHVGSVVLVNGVPLGVEPTPLLHGDKIELGGHELLFGDDKKGGSTQYVPSLTGYKAGGNGNAAGAAPRGAGAATAATGGLLRSLVDGREYQVTPTGLVIGRDAGCDVVVPSSEVSRRHAAITPSAGGGGYELRDMSTNGVWLNGSRIESMATLGRGDVVRIGGEEFRFYADVPAAAPAAAVAPPPVAAPPAAAPPAAPPATGTPAPAGRSSLVAPMADFELAVPKPARSEPATDPARAPVAANTPVPAAGSAASSASASAAPSRTALATLEVVNEGVLKGQRFEIRHPLAHVGRGEHNDIVIAEESVSDSHAKLQKREGRWFVVDMGSTNGTYLAGRRLDGEQELAAGADVRFGGIKLRFQPLADRAEEGKGTRVIAGANLEAAKRAAAAPGAPVRRQAPAPAPAAAPKKSSPVVLIVLVVVLLAAAAAYFLGIGR